MRALRKLYAIAAPTPWLLIGASSLLLLETAAALVTPTLAGRFGEQVLNKVSAAPYAGLLMALLALMLLQHSLRFLSGYLIGNLGATTTARLRVHLYDHLQALPLHYHQAHQRGDSLTLLSRDAGVVGQFFTNTLPSLAPQLLLLIGAWIMLFSLSPVLGLVIGAAVPLIVLAFKVLWRKIQPLANQLAQAHAAHLGAAEENLHLIKLLKAYGREKRESARLAGFSNDILALERKHLLLTSAIPPLVQAVGALLLITVLWLGAQQLLQGQLSSADAISLLLYGLLLFRPASQLASAMGNLQSTRGAAARINDALSTPKERLDTGDAVLPAQAGKITLENLHFRYPGRSALLHDINFTINPGEIVAITGLNGSGKTTLVNLIMRFWAPTSGRILLGDQDIAKLKPSVLRQAIGLVPQEVALFTGSVRDNIAYGMPNASEAAIHKAAETAQALDFINRLPDGMDTQLGPEGFSLSGGQRQRIALARALLRDCPILILDEATAMFDADAEANFARICRAQTQGRTLLLIAHREASLSLADRHLDLNDPESLSAP